MDEELNDQTNTQTSNAMNKIKQGASNVANKIGQVSKKVKKTIANPLVWKVILIALPLLTGILLMVMFVALIVNLFTVDTFNKDKATMNSLYGINGEKFYGARFLYRDDEIASIEMQDDYLKFTYTILLDANIDGITIDSDYKNDEKIIKIATDFAKQLANMPQDGSSEIGKENYTFEESTYKIDHFGFKNEEISVVIDSIANTIKDNYTTENSLEQIKTNLTKIIVGSNYDKYKQVCDKIFVYDYIFDKDDSILEDLPKKNYVGFVFMPKENVEVKSTSFRFVVDGGYGVNTLIKYKNNSTITNLIEETNVNVTWYIDGDYKILETPDVNLSVSKFDAINQANLTELETPVSIHTLLNDGNFNSYFNIQEGELSAVNLIDNINTTNYLYLTFSSFDPFNFAEYITEY